MAIGKANLSGITPTTVAVVFPIRMSVPTISGSAASRSAQTSYPTTVTGGAPGVSSSRVSTRPISGGTPARSKPDDHISATTTGVPTPSVIRLADRVW